MRDYYEMEEVNKMNLCNISEEGPKSIKECNKGIEMLNNLYKVVELGKQILPSAIGYRVNVTYFMEHCFCKVKIKTDHRSFRRLKPQTIVYFYTTDISAITTLICDVYGKFYDISDNLIPGRHWTYDRYYKIGIPYADLKDFLLECIGAEIDGLKEWCDELEY